MLDKALKFIQTINENGYEAYIIGGFVRDHLLGIESNDIDICTNAKPSDIREIFKENCMPNDDYGSVVVNVQNTQYEVTTYRKEISYINNRKPLEYEYINDLSEDLKRRDFTINTICMDKDGNIIDLLNGKDDLVKREINTVGDSETKFSEDSLRILRAVRFATQLDFRLSEDVKESILKTKHLLKSLSMERKKEELNKIFTSTHINYGIRLLLELGLDEELELSNLKKLNKYDDLMSIWALLNVDDIYPFTKNEKDMMDDIRKVLELDNLDSMTLYKYGLYVNSVAGGIKGLDKKQIAYKYENLPIKDRNEINITGEDIMRVLNIEPGKMIKDVLDDIEESIIMGKLENNTDSIIEYIVNKYISTLN